jgi:hypothetical protein
LREEEDAQARRAEWIGRTGDEAERSGGEVMRDRLAMMET